MPNDEAEAFAEASAIVAAALERIEDWPIMPRELEDILGVTTTERRRWLADGRLHSCGARTARFGGGTVTFQVFDPRVVEEILDVGLVDSWRADDADKAAERRDDTMKKKRLRLQTSSRASLP